MPSKKVLLALNISFIIILFYIYLSGIGSYELFSKDEPRYAGCALEMIENNDWIYPKFNFEDRFDKPALFYWLIAISYKLIGINPFASRLPSALSAILLVLFTWYTAKKILGSIPGFLSGLILATCVEHILLGRRAATDIVLCLFFSSSLYSMYLSYFLKEVRMKILWVIASGIFAGLAILTKGPIAIVLPLAILTGFLIFRKQIDIKHIKIYFLICFIAGLVSIPWYIAVHIATHGEFTKAFFFTHNLERFTSVVGEHPGPIWFYFPVLLIGFLPWTPFFLASLPYFTKHLFKKTFNKFALFCLIWISLIFIFFSICKTKMPTYLLLLFPPLSIITGYWISLIGKKKENLIKQFFIVLIVVLLIAVTVAYFLINKSHYYESEKAFLLQNLTISLIMLFIGLVFTWIKTKKYYSIITASIITIAIPAIIMINAGFIIYNNKTFGDLIDFSRTAKSLGAHEIIAYCGYKPVLVYYGRIPVDFNPKGEQIKKIKRFLSEKKEIYTIGYLSDLNPDKEFVRKNSIVFKRLKIIKSGKKYFLGKFS